MLGKRLLLALTVLAAACGDTGLGASASPTPDPSRPYVALIHSYYAKYEMAKGDAADYCLVGTDAAKCKERGVLMIAVWETFLKDLDKTPAPPKFAADDAAIRKQLPKAIDDLKRMVVAAAAGDHYGMTGATGNYVSDMVPTVTDALHHVDPVWPEEH